MFALKLKNKFAFICASSEEHVFEKQIDKAFWNWRGIQPQGKETTKEDFLANYDNVVITIEPYNVDLTRLAEGQSGGAKRNES